jgi:hypothetical protein
MSDQSLTQAWQPFFTTLAGACAVLAGLVFIAVSLHPQITLANTLMRQRALVAASGFLLGLTWSLIMLVPAGTAPLGSVLLFAAGVVGGTTLICQQIRARKLGVSRVRTALGNPLLLVPVVAGVMGLQQPASSLPFVLIAVATTSGLFVLFSQSWSLVLHSIPASDGRERSESRGEAEPVRPRLGQAPRTSSPAG